MCCFISNLFHTNAFFFFLILYQNRRPYIDKSETQPFLTTTTTTSASLSPTVPISSGTSTINRTLLHHQNLGGSAMSVPTGGIGSGRDRDTVSSSGRNGTIGMRGLELQNNPSSSDSPPPDYNFVMHGIRHASFV